ncbi:hypothetical protein ACOZ4N_07140 [Halorientalis pallida]|uniref:hypothetical protein n=1 Tax=Halorientalis pallida TaxID=2479928 RepID=UPI003C7011CA
MVPDTSAGSVDDGSALALSRRSLLAAGGATLASAVAGCSDSTPARGWNTVDTPVGDALYDVVITQAGPYAVGGGGAVLTRADDAWTAVTKQGPGEEGNTLYGADVSDGGRQLWFCGGSGAVGAYDTLDERLTDFSAPEGKTSSWADVAVAGRAGNERVALVNSSGEYLPGKNRNGTVEWGTVTKPTGGESASAVDLVGRRAFVADTGGTVARRAFRARSDNRERRWTAIGIDDTGAELTDLVAFEHDLVLTVTDGGEVFDYDGHAWMRDDVTDGSLRAVDRRGGRGLVAGAEGRIFALTDHAWTEQETPTGTTLHGCALGTDQYVDVAVGEGGTLLERFG